MCGIVCYKGHHDSVEIILDGLKSLEYRGYDSAGISTATNGTLQTVKRKGKLDSLREALQTHPIKGNIGIGHIRWATHGEPNDINSHPHLSDDGKIAVVHNGIIENYLELKHELQEKGIHFISQTDTEVIANLIGYYYEDDLLKALRKAVSRLQGAYALGVLSHSENRLIAVRYESPLILGICPDGYLLASDIPSVLKHTRDIVYLENHDIVDIKDDTYTIYNQDTVVQRSVQTTELTVEDASKSGFDHFMIKEIFDQPDVIEKTVRGRMKDGHIDLGESSFTEEELENFEKIYIVACGTAFHAGEVGKYAIEKLARIPVMTQIASEYRYADPFVDEKTLVIMISQSGETADTLAALRESKKRGATVLSITNVVGSSIARESNKVMYCYAGPEIAVASTKAYTTQLACIYLLALDFAAKKGQISREELSQYIDELSCLPNKITQILDREREIKEIADQIKTYHSVFFVGRGLDFLSVKEGALKLKEISYIHTEAFPAGELKHGSIALIEDGTPCISIITQSSLRDKTLSNMEELITRGASVYSIACEGEEKVASISDRIFFIPKTKELFYPILTVVPQQLLGYYTSILKGNDVDKPRNLAKSVTVE